MSVDGIREAQRELWKLDKPQLVARIIADREVIAMQKTQIESRDMMIDHYQFTLNVVAEAMFDPDGLATPERYESGGIPTYEETHTQIHEVVEGVSDVG